MASRGLVCGKWHDGCRGVLATSWAWPVDRQRCVRRPFCYIGTIVPYPTDSEGLKGLARVTFRNSIPYEGTGETAPAPGDDLPPLPPYRQWEAANPVEADRIRARERRRRPNQ